MKKLLAGFCLIALPFSFVWADTSLLQGAIVYSPNKISKFDWLQGYDGSQPCGSCTGSPSVRNGACGIDTSVSGFQFQINTNGQAACNNIVVWQCPPPANSKNKPHSLLGVNPCNFNNAYQLALLVAVMIIKIRTNHVNCRLLDNTNTMKEIKVR